jgi:homoserine dehydrogenase
MASSTNITQTISVAVIGVGLVGAEFVRQLLALPAPHPFRLVALSSSKTHIFAPDGLPDGDWRAALAASPDKPDVPALVKELAALVTPGRRVVLVDNTSSDAVAGFYPEFLRVGVSVATPNKKGFSAGIDLYDRILAASLESGARFYNESTVGAGLPIISTLKDLVATGDKVRSWRRRCGRSGDLTTPTGLEDRGRLLRHTQLHLQ